MTKKTSSRKKPNLKPVPKASVSKDYARARKQQSYLEDRLEDLKAQRNEYRAAFDKKKQEMNEPLGEQIKKLQEEAQSNHLKIEGAFGKKTEKISKEILDIENEKLPEARRRALALADRVVGKKELDAVDGTVDTTVEGPTLEEEVDALIDDVDSVMGKSDEDEDEGED